jgi:DNA (cytosine-5)-methyltransferase 1
VSVVGLFAGIGGFELGFSRAGFEPTLLVDVDPAARAVLKERFPGVDIGCNIEDLAELPAGTQILTAGFPCQNLSMAGDKSGIGGPKSGIVTKMLELVASSRIPVVVIENVPFMLHLDSGKAMSWLVAQFEGLGYKWAYRILDTRAFGLPQRRRRVYFVAASHLDPRRVLLADDDPQSAAPVPEVGLDAIGFYWTEGRSGVGFAVDGIPPLKAGSGRGIPSAPAVLFPDGEVLMPSPTALEALQGFPVGWTEPADLVEPGSRWRLVGNAVSVPVAQWLADRIRKPGVRLQLDKSAVQPGRSWPNAAHGTANGPVALSVSAWPIAREAASIVSLRDQSWTRLSARALDGFYRRAQEGGLRMPEGFLDALRRAPRKSASRQKTRGGRQIHSPPKSERRSPKRR